MEKILILNSGGTFGKIYNKLNGNLEIDTENMAVLDILSTFYNLNYELKSVVLKDSLEFTYEDRKEIFEVINSSSCKACILIHGTDTMEVTAKFLKEEGVNKLVVLTGAMMPYSISKTEAATNFAMCVGFLQNEPKNDVYIGMHGVVTEYQNITKNRKIGQFEITKEYR
jgi:L-asparaginase